MPLLYCMLCKDSLPSWLCCHANTVTAVLLLCRIVRSRQQGELDKCDIVVDVGGVYDPATHRYDHHQKYVLSV